METKRFLGVPVLGAGLVVLPEGIAIGKYRFRFWINNPVEHILKPIKRYLKDESKTKADKIKYSLSRIGYYIFYSRGPKRVQVLGCTYELTKAPILKTRELTTEDKLNCAAKKLNQKWRAEHLLSATGYQLIDENNHSLKTISYDEAGKTPFCWEEVLGWK